MTQQYLAGELSILLAEVQAVAPPACTAEADLLRRQAETTPPPALSTVAAGALQLIDRLCWTSLDCGDTAAFAGQVRIARRLFEFSVCAHMLDEP